MDLGRRDAGLLDLLDLEFAHPQAAQRIERHLETQGRRSALVPDGRVSALRLGVRLQREHERLRCGHQVGRVVRGQHLVLLDEDAGRILAEFADPAVGRGDEPVLPCVIDGDAAGRPQQVRCRRPAGPHRCERRSTAALRH